MFVKNLNRDDVASETMNVSPFVRVLPPATVSTTLSPADSVLETVAVAKPLVITNPEAASSAG